MTKEEKLLSLLQPPEYKSKVKLYCNTSTAQIIKKGIVTPIETKNDE